MAILCKQDILKADDLRYTVVDVPEWGGEVRIKTMCLADQLHYEAVRKGEETEKIIVELVCMSCVDENGNRLFDIQDVEILNKKSADVVCRLFTKCLEHNALKVDAVESDAKK